MRIVVCSQAREGSIPVVYVALDVEVSTHLNGSVIAQLEKAATPVGIIRQLHSLVAQFSAIAATGRFMRKMRISIAVVN